MQLTKVLGIASEAVRTSALNNRLAIGMQAMKLRPGSFTALALAVMQNATSVQPTASESLSL